MTADPFATPGDKIPSYDRPRGDAEDRAPVPRDPWDRYRTPFIDGTMPAANKGHTRVSTIKDSVVDKRGINRNNIGLVAAGIATVPALAKAAAEAVRDDDKKALRAVADRALTAAGGKDRAALGTAVHDATERINRGEQDVHVPEEYRADVDAYYQLLAENDVRVLPEFMERTVLCPYNSAGTFDNIVQWFNPELGDIDEETGKPIGEWEWLIADLKTGRSLEDGKLEIMIQLWLYANAYGVLDLDTMTYSPLPVEVRQDRAMIIHVPMAGGVAELFVIDISGAERYVRAAVEIRRGNREAKNSWRSVGKVTHAPFVLAPGSMQNSVRNGDNGLQAPAVVVETVSSNPQTSGVQRTPQQIADAETAERRRALHQGGPQSGTVPVDPREVGAIIPIAEAAGLVRTQDGGIQDKAVNAQTAVDGEGKPLAPLAGPGKRGCSKCGRTGHRSTSKRCLGNADPAKAPTTAQGPDQPVPVPDADQRAYDYAAQTISPEFAAALAPNHPVGEQGPEPFVVPDDAAVVSSAGYSDVDGSRILPWCDVPQHRSQGWTAGPDGTAWVCPVDGRPSRESYERSQVDPIAVAIDAQTTPEAVLQIRTVQIAAGKWTPTYDEQARLKHQALSWPTP